MVKKYSQVASTAEIQDALEFMKKNKEVNSVLLFLADCPEIDRSSLDFILKNYEKSIIGGIFPEIIFNNEKKQSGFYVVGLKSAIQTCLLDLSEVNDDLGKDLEKFASEVEKSAEVIWVFMDAFAENKDAAINALYDEFGPNKNYIGGGAGTLQLKSTPSIVSNSGLQQDCAIVAAMNCEGSIGVAHGWQPITEPVKVTQTNGRTIQSFEWNASFEYYKNIIKEHSGLEITEDNFFDIAKSYPLGLMKLNSEFIVRDPISTDGIHLNIIDLVPQNEFVQILNGDKESLFKGAAAARKNANKVRPGSNFFFCIDCISRVLFLGDDFGRELNEISSGDEIIGILTIGEIANAGNSMLEIYNKTVVVCNISC